MTPKISKADCEKIRERVKRGAMQKHLAREYDVSYKTILNHANGECKHIVEEWEETLREWS